MVGELAPVAWSDPLGFYRETSLIANIHFVISPLGCDRETYGLVEEIDLEFPPLSHGSRDL